MKASALHLYLLLAALSCGAATPAIDTNVVAKGDWFYLSHDSNGQRTETRLDRKQVTALIGLIDSHTTTAAHPVEPQSGGPLPAVSPDLVIDIRSTDGKLLCQVLGIDHEMLGGWRSVTDKKTVRKVYDIVKKKN